MSIGYIRHLLTAQADVELMVLLGHLSEVFTNPLSLQRWLASREVNTYFQEFRAWVLDDVPNSSEPDFAAVMMQMAVTHGGRIPRAVSESRRDPDWTIVQHTCRFIEQVVVHHNDGDGRFDWDDEHFEEAVWRVYEILMYLMGRWQRERNEFMA